MAQEASEWEEGTLGASQYQPDLATTLAVMMQARDRVSSLPPYPGQPKVDSLYLASMTLYVASAKADQASLDIERNDLREQLALLAERVRELGDRVFDQGRLLTGQSLVPTGLSGAKVELPSQVPDWSAEGLAAGPPLAQPPAASVPKPGLQPVGSSAIRFRLSELVRDEARLAMIAAGLLPPNGGGLLRDLGSELDGAAQMVR